MKSAELWHFRRGASCLGEETAMEILIVLWHWLTGAEDGDIGPYIDPAG